MQIFPNCFLLFLEFRNKKGDNHKKQCFLANLKKGTKEKPYEIVICHLVALPMHCGFTYVDTKLSSSFIEILQSRGKLSSNSKLSKVLPKSLLSDSQQKIITFLRKIAHQVSPHHVKCKGVFSKT